MSLFEIIIVIAVMVLLPIIPAFILFKYLPSKGIVEGSAPLPTGHGGAYNFKFRGAFAGYFVIFAVLVGLHAKFLYGELISKPEWKVKGKIILSDGAEMDQNVKFLIEPPTKGIIKPSGNFEIKNILLAENKGKNSLTLNIEKESYIAKSLNLSETNPLTPEDECTYSWKDKTISIKNPIKLKRMPRGIIGGNNAQNKYVYK